MVAQASTAINLQARIEHLKSRPLASTAKTVRETRVRLHRCFAQTFQSVKPKRCKCREYLSYTEAVVSVQRGDSDWLLVPDPRKESLVPYFGAIVVRVTEAERAEQVQQVRTNRETENRILKKFRNLIWKKFTNGNLPQAVVQISDAELRAFLGNPEKLQDCFPEFGEKKLWAKVLQLSTDFWTNHTDSAQNLSDGEYLTDAPKGRGRLVSGGYDLKKLETVGTYDAEAALEAGNIREMSGLFRVKSQGQGPDSYEREGSDDE